MVFIKKIKKGNSVYVAKAESYRDGDRVRQRCVEYLGKLVDGKIDKKFSVLDSKFVVSKESFSVSVIHELAECLKITTLDPNILMFVYSQILEDNLSISKLDQWLKKTEIPQVLRIENFSRKQK